MADEGQKKTDKEIKKVEDQIKSVYGQAQKEIEDKLKNFEENFKIKKDIYYQKYKNHEITQKDYNSWRAGQLFQMEQWKAKRDQICDVLHHANEQAANIVNGGTISAFAGGANWTAYELEHGEGINFGFGLYDAKTVTSLIKDNPQILPKWKIDEPKEYVWNKQKVNNCVTQGIIQGESLQDIGKRIAEVTCNQNMNLAMTHAQTAMGGAQNAGRMQRLQDAKKLGINVVKEWMATLDEHTRDTHAEIDGEQQPVGDKWHHIKFSNGCEYPCDPNGPAHEVFNCRCTLVGDVTDYPDEYQRYDNIDGEPIDNMTYKEWEKLKFADKVAAENAKEAEKVQVKIDAKQQEIDNKQQEIADAEQQIKVVGADAEFVGIWKDKVTYADWDAKKDSIEAKRDYYNQQIDKYQNVKDDRMQQFADDIGEDKDVCEDLYNRIEYCELNGLDVITDNEIQDILMSMGLDVDDIEDISLIFEGINKDLMWSIDKLNALDEFEKHGELYSNMLKDYQALQDELKGLQGELKDLNAELKGLTPSTGPFGADAYTQQRKDDALWAQSAREADAVLRGYTGEAWQNASRDERHAAYDYTAGSGGFNRPLRGYDGSWYSGNYKGVGNVDLNNERRGQEILDLTALIDKCELPTDVWLQRGVDDDGLAGFLGIPVRLIENGSQEDLEKALLGKEISDPAFMSCGSSKGQGFGGNILNVYCPEGTKAIYAEPFSAYGRGGGSGWDGKSTQSSFGGEDETILQRNTYFRIIKVEKSSSGWSDRIYVDIEVIDQRPDEIKYN